MYLLDNTLRPYAWGSEHAIAELLGREPSGGPEAELWVGAHPGSPSQVLLADGSRCGLDELIGSDPEALLGPVVAARFDGRLPFLLKVLAAGSALSLQVHPSLEQAAAGYDAEEAAGVPRDAPHRNYRDRNHKPEMIFALTPFEALCGFRPLAGARAAFAFLAGLVDAGTPARELLDAVAGTLGEDAAETSAENPTGDVAAPASAALQSAFRRLLETPEDVVTAVTTAAGGQHGTADDAGGSRAGTLATVAELSRQYPGDPGVLVALLLNRVSLQPGQALHLPAGNIHAYLGGLGIEVMASSDNVLRGGLTPKHVDTGELLDTVVFEPLAPPALEAQFTFLDQELYRPPFDEFLLQRMLLGDPAADGTGTGSAAEGSRAPAHCPVLQNGPVVVLAVSGAILLDTPNSSLLVPRGGSAFVAASEAPLLARPAADHDGATDGPVLAFAVTVGGDVPTAMTRNS
ncbi:mannose-6-phosphate isomerase [Arthrobacter sp. RIT-PI-e]|uniref:mannose-6-phosphate isomerase, class I n=1 Tax=Arthrobacter sp. RIT-PI-e TaxID=1681197 RepID=UPI000675CA76|nr:mannose-6-phosphate isomerase, class I [Arthrobacter sp. RIT-PI-e]KNC19641.1 mannose-6-phosphate isomerase [Arthrobacter sp. RIT-PI-e]